MDKFDQMNTAAKADIVLVNPPSERVVEEYDAPSYGHLGLAYLGSALRQNGLGSVILDAKLSRLGFDETVDRISKFGPKVIGITSFTHEINLTARLASRLKEVLPQSRIILGGVHASSLAEETLRRIDSIDYLVKGEGEISFVRLARAILSGNEGVVRRVPGVGCRDGGGVIVSPQGEWIQDLDSIDFPAWDLFTAGMKSFPVISSRGCPFQCVFCARMMGERVRTRSPENIIAELKLLNEKFGASEIYFYDETFGFYKKWLDQFIKLMVETGLASRMTWGITTRAHLLNPDTVSAMKKAGCRKIDFGVESGDDRILKIINKQETKEDFIRAAKVLKDAGIKSHSYYIIGHPYETKESALNTIDFAARLNTDIISIGIMIPYPGTKVAELATRGEGGYKKLSADWADYNKQLGNALELDTISRPELTKLQILGYAKFYLQNFKILPFIATSWRYRKLILAILTKYFRSQKTASPSESGRAC